jgi:hypothetical protein
MNATGSAALADRRAWRPISRSAGPRELAEGSAAPAAGGGIGGEFAVAAADARNERMTGGADPAGRPVPGRRPTDSLP